MIGINSQILSATGSSSGIGFAVPASIARRVVPQLIRSGYVARPRLGVTTRSVRGLGDAANLSVSGGALIMSVEPGSAAAIAGLRATIETEEGGFRLGDVITQVDGEEINGADDLTRVLDRRNVGDMVRVEIMRDRERLVVPVRLGAARREVAAQP